MADDLRQKLERWVRQQIFVDIDDGELYRLSLHHANPGQKGSVVFSRPFKEKIDSDDIASIVDEFYDAAIADCNGLGGVQRYVLYSFFSEEPKKIAARLSFRIQGYDESIDDVEDGEPPTKTGFLQQTMRHNEQIMRTSVAATGTAMRTLQHLTSRLADRNEALEERLADNFELIEQLSQERHVREMEMRETEGQEDRKQIAFQRGMQLLPAAVNKLVGKTVMPVEVDPTQMQIKDFAESLSPRQFQQLQAILGPEQQINLVTLLQQIGYGSEEAGKGSEEEKEEASGNGAKT